MIQKFKIKNYKSLRNVEIDLNKFNVLIGPNASGKSNLLDCLAFISEIAQGRVDEGISKRGGYEHVVFGGERRNIELSIKFPLDNKPSEYFISISDKGIDKENLTIGKEVVIDRELDKFKILMNDKKYREGSYGRDSSLIYGYGNKRFKDEYFLTFKTKGYLSSWKSYNFITSQMRKIYPAQRKLVLDGNGGNLAQVLVSLHNECPKMFDRIENMLKQGIPQIEELLTPLTPDGKTYVAIREKGFDSPFDYYQVSDGILKLLAYITAISPIEPKLICFEEPENFIHPRLFELLVEILKKSEKQIILSTHSPYLLDWIEPENVIVVEKKEKETIMRKIEDTSKLKEHLGEIGLSLGEYWYGNGLGGNP
jgi:predicted ATPase